MSNNWKAATVWYLSDPFLAVYPVFWPTLYINDDL